MLLGYRILQKADYVTNATEKSRCHGFQHFVEFSAARYIERSSVNVEKEISKINVRKACRVHVKRAHEKFLSHTERQPIYSLEA